ncbi:hypothetical protein PoB_001819600 [Plakobranchus ocellatus]|uniref:Uncharacterized protein n=1 Tax=Plakobranchus ocellatus TaxID=259542 RepID=A0AAV3ZAK5_9GAST|nr:hypothetical protein PoB_001819600 [Plakobranchus ocellatus]
MADFVNRSVASDWNRKTKETLDNEPLLHGTLTFDRNLRKEIISKLIVMSLYHNHTATDADYYDEEDDDDGGGGGKEKVNTGYIKREKQK